MPCIKCKKTGLCIAEDAETADVICEQCGRCKEVDYIKQAKALLKSPYCISPGPEAETAIPIIRGLLATIEEYL